jgi:arylsulfatase
MEGFSAPRNHHVGVWAGLALFVVVAGLVIWSPSFLPWTSGDVYTGGPYTYDRTKLPMDAPPYPFSTVLDARDAVAPPPFEVKAPEGAPNVVIVLIDDMGFGHSSAFGGSIPMPFAEKLAAEGLRYNEFHTTALCSPTRTALQTGRNHHTGNNGSIAETATGFPGNNGLRPYSVAPLADILRLNGYNTAAFGKFHEVAAWETSQSGPYDRWPTGSGFEKFYGFLGGETNQWSPLLHDGTSLVEPPSTDEYHLNTDLADKAIAWVQSQRTLTPDKPFMMYFATGATHAPHQVPAEWSDKFKGKFDSGWDAYRAQILEQQKKLGVVPPDTVLAAKPEAIRDWDALTADEKRLYARQMEIFAGFLAYTDFEIGRVAQAIEDAGAKDNTIFMYILGDNGASAEGTENGLLNEFTYFNGIRESFDDILARIDDLGGQKSNGHYASGWAVAGDVPFEWTKQVASSYGGTRNGFIVRWPKGITEQGGIRGQWHHVVDVAQTVLEAAGLPEPTEVHGVAQTPMEGVSMLYSFNDPNAVDRHETQYFEIFGNRAIYDKGWLAGTVHTYPWSSEPRNTLADDVWELYDTKKDFSLANDLASQMPDKLEEMKDLFDEQATKYHIYPLDDRREERFDAKIAGRPDLIGDRTSLTVYEGMKGMMDNIFISVRNRDSSVTAELETDGKADGVVIAQGGRFGGWSLYLEDGKPRFHYNWLGIEQFSITSSEALPAGKVTLEYQFTYDGPGMGKSGTGKLLINGRVVGEGRIGKTVPIIFGEAAGVGEDAETPVTEAYTSHDSAFTGDIARVTIDVGPLQLSEADYSEYTRLALAYQASGCQ